MAFSFYALIYFLPISIALSETFTGFTLFFWLFKRGAALFQNVKNGSLGWASLSFLEKSLALLRSFKPIDNYLRRPIAIFLFCNFLSVVMSRYPTISIEGFFGKALQNTFLYFNFIEAVNSPKRLRTFLTVFFISGVLICASGLYQYIFGHDFIHGHLIYDGRVSSSFRAHNDFAAYLVVIVPVLLSLSLLTAINGIKQSSSGYMRKYVFSPFLSPQGKGLIFFVLILSLVCLGLTFSRGAWIAFAFAILLFSTQKKRYMLASGIVLILFFGVFYPQLKEIRQVRLIVDSVSRKGTPLNGNEAAQNGETQAGTQGPAILRSDEKKFNIFRSFKEKLGSIEITSGSGRSGYWMEAIHMIKDYPVFGVGLNAYSVVGRGYKINWGGYPHNCYLQMAAETGILGLLSFFWLLFVLCKNSFTALRKMRDSVLSALLVGFLTGFSGFLLHSFFDTNFYSVQLGSFMWLIMGLIVVVQKIDKSTPVSEPT